MFLPPLALAAGKAVELGPLRLGKQKEEGGAEVRAYAAALASPLG
jgi:hypothetical protein